MKHTTILLTLAATLFLSISCGDKNRYAAFLLSAEQTARVNPYDAIVALEGLKDSLCHTEADSALYGLVYAEALRGHGLQMGNVEYFNKCADFFRRQGDDDRTARALLQIALCLFDKGDYIEAVTKMKESEVIATPIDDQDLRNRLFLSLAHLNDMAGSDSLARFYHARALTAARRINEPNRTAMTLNAMAEFHLRRGETDRFKKCMSLCESLLDSISNSNRAIIEATMGCYYLAKGDTARAKQLFSYSQIVCPDRKSSLYLGDIYADEGDKKRASVMWYDASNSSDTHIRKNALSRLIAWAEAQGNMEEAFYLSNLLNGIYKDDIPTTTAASVVALQDGFDRRQTEQRGKTKALIVAITATLIVGAVVALSIFLARRSAKRKERSASHWKMENRLLTADCVHRLHHLAATGKTAQKGDWDALHTLVSQHDKPLSVFLERHKNLSAAEIGVVMLTRLRFMPSEIATLTAASSQVVTNTRTRLLRKIFGKEGGAKDFDRAIRDI